MKTFSRKTITVLLVLLCAGAVWGVRSFNGGSGAFGPFSESSSRSKGRPDAPLKIVEHVDFQCKTCADSYVLLNNYLYTYPDKIRLELKYQPLVRVHLYALKSAIYAECAGRQRKFWPFASALFENQAEWSASKEPDQIFKRLAAGTGLDIEALGACVDGPEAKARVIAEKDAGLKNQINLTPTFFVNGKRVVGVQALREELDRHFKAKT